MDRVGTRETVAAAWPGGGLRPSYARASLLSGVILLACIVFAGQAAAASYTWKGESTTTPNWSASANWESGSVPSTPAALTFPRLTRASCSAATQTEACYDSQNNLSGLAVESMQVDDGDTYEIWGNKVSLGSAGLTASPAVGSSGSAGDFVELPIELTAAQSWSVVNHTGGAIGEKGIFLLSEVTGAHPLTVTVSEGAALYMAASAEVGALTIQGAKSTGAGVLNGFGALLGSRLNSADGSQVELSHIFFIATGATGPLKTTSAELSVGSPEYPSERLSAQSATFDAGSEVEFKVSGSGTTAGVDYAQLTSSGAVELGGAKLSLRVVPPSEGRACPSLAPGVKYTLVSATGTLSGTFGNAPEGSEIPIKFAKSCQQVSQFLKIAYNTSGSTHTVVGTVIAGPSSSTSLAVLPGSATTNQAVNLTATVTASAGTPVGTVDFLQEGIAIPACAAQSVRWTGASYAATCTTSFPASVSHTQLSAVFTPEPGANLKASESGLSEVTVGKDPTSTRIEALNPKPQIGASVTYTAYVAPQDTGPATPSGVVEFLDGGTPIKSCSSQPLSTARATCQVSYDSAGAHSITARYAGDVDFASSTSMAQSVEVESSVSSQSSGAANEVVTPHMPSGLELASHELMVASSGWSAVKIECKGIEDCEGKLVLQVKQKVHKHGHRASSRFVAIGEADFSIAGSTNVNVAIRIDALGRRLLTGLHGRLTARLLVVRPKPASNESVTVHLAEKAAHRRGKHRR